MKSELFAFGWVILFAVGSSLEGNPRQSPETFPILKGPYLGQTPPRMKAVLFAPGAVSTGMTERAIAVAPDGREIYFELSFGRIVTIMMTKIENGRWTEPVIAPFASDSKYFHFEPALSADGRKIFFLTNRPRPGKESKPGWAYQHIWAADRGDDGSWSDPYDVGDSINTADNEYYPSLTDDGTLYFTRSKGAPNKPAIFRSRFLGGKFQPAEALPEAVNGKGTPYNAVIAPDEGYLIACVDGREDSLTKGLPNYYIFFHGPDDRWSEGVNLGAEVNFPGSSANAPSLTRDMKYFFFGSAKPKPFDVSVKPVTLSMLREYFSGPQNGGSDIYWIDAAFLQNLRPSSSK